MSDREKRRGKRMTQALFDASYDPTTAPEQRAKDEAEDEKELEIEEATGGKPIPPGGSAAVTPSREPPPKPNLPPYVENEADVVRATPRLELAMTTAQYLNFIDASPSADADAAESTHAGANGEVPSKSSPSSEEEAKSSSPSGPVLDANGASSYDRNYRFTMSRFMSERASDPEYQPPPVKRRRRGKRTRAKPSIAAAPSASSSSDATPTKPSSRAKSSSKPAPPAPSPPPQPTSFFVENLGTLWVSPRELILKPGLPIPFAVTNHGDFSLCIFALASDEEFIIAKASSKPQYLLAGESLVIQISCNVEGRRLEGEIGLVSKPVLPGEEKLMKPEAFWSGYPHRVMQKVHIPIVCDENYEIPPPIPSAANRRASQQLPATTLPSTPTPTTPIIISTPTGQHPPSELAFPSPANAAHSSHSHSSSVTTNLVSTLKDRQGNLAKLEAALAKLESPLHSLSKTAAVNSIRMPMGSFKASRRKNSHFIGQW